MNKKAIAGILITSILAFGATALNVSADNNVPKVVLNDKEISFPDAKPYINNDERTMVPLRFITDALGCEIEWIESTSTVLIKKDGSVISLKIGENFSSITDKNNKVTKKELDTKAELKDDRTMVPLRFISETLGAAIDYDEATNTIILKVEAAAPVTPAPTVTPTPTATSTPTATPTSTTTPKKDGRVIKCGSVSEIQNALKNAQPGDTIIIKEGTYTGDKATSGNTGAYFFSDKNGTADAHITIMSDNASKPATFQGKDINSSYTLYLMGDYWDVKDLKLTTAKKGIMIDNANYVTLSGLEVYNIGEEGIHYRDGSSYGVVENSKVYDTGLVNPEYGEGIYVGSDGGKWKTYKKETDHIIIRNNTISNTKAEPIDIKEGTTGIIVDGNTFIGTGISGANSADSFMDVKGNDCVIKNNIGYQKGNSIIVNAFEVHKRADGWGQNNDFSGNTVYMDNKTANVVYTDSNATAKVHNNTRSPEGNMYSGNVTEY